MTNNPTDDNQNADVQAAQQAAAQASKATQEAEAARKQVQDLQKTIKNSSTTPGDPTTATTSQLITGDY